MLRILHARLRATSRPGDEGIALVLVISIGAVLTVLMTAAIAYGLGAFRKADSDASWSSAIAAAYAGIEEYQSRLANDPTYLQYGNPASPFSDGTENESGEVSDVALPTTENEAFGVGAAGTWADVAGSGGEASYRYEVDNSQYYETGTLYVRSTGRVGGETRTIVADLRQQGFIDFLYFTDYEIQDPAMSGDANSCVRYAYAGRPTGCSEIAFGSNDVVDGPAHSNDRIRICDARFKGALTTSYNPTSGLRYTPRNSLNNSCGGQVFDLAGSPAYSPIIGMPQTNSQLKREVRSDLTGGEVPNPGCLYTGPTRIQLNTDGTITVRSPWTRATRVAGDPATSGTAPAACGAIASLQSAGGATFTPPANNVIYVQNVPTVASDPNYHASGAVPVSGFTCNGGTGASRPDGTSAVGYGNGIGYPATNERMRRNNAYECRTGDVFVQGTLDGQMTIAAEKYIYVTGDIRYEDANDDMLGLIGTDAIWIWNPVNSSNQSLLGGSNRRVDAAMLSVAHTMQVQNYDVGGNRGTLTVTGAIAQKFRGIVRSGSNGYAKQYLYDERLRYTAPPKFLSPVTTTYGVTVWIEVGKAFESDGTVAG
ncbi:hypothetical protein OVN20_04470 [Microcella daejeonensis]|uniref:hypothetical protein n=1 Tax=Microcella daejeonensis TaxID=2994971 RepID=UPI00226E85EC|nr:hypothetical protein [Microcella daejeonensis]WAB84826.1 hypothetical protein OVN20_04470 [Microcella daejeonensis]